MKYLVLILLLACCGQQYQDEPTRIVWSLYGENHAPPSVSWHFGSCPWVHGHGILYRGKCYNGLYFPDDDEAEIEWRENWHDSAFAHELLHAWLWKNKGDPDYNHDRPEWEWEQVAIAELTTSGY